MSHDIQTMTVAELAQAISAKSLTPLEITQSYLDQIASHDFAHRIYSEVLVESALAAAHAATERQAKGTRLSILDGIPISWKDLFDIKGHSCEAGSAFLKDRIAPTTAKVVENSNQFGLIPLGKTHLSELAFSGLGLNPVMQTTPCVNDIEAVSGGSSSGAAGSVAFGLAPAGIGSDTGGSVRVPSAWNDLTGVKTTHGSLSSAGVVPLCTRFDTAGPLAKNMTDAGFLYQAMAGHTPQPMQPQKVTQIAVLQGIPLQDLDPSVKTANAASLQKLEDAGIALEPLHFGPLEEMLSLAPIIFSYEAYHQWKTEITEMGDLMFQPIRERFLSGNAFTQEDYNAAWSRLNEIRRAWLQAVAPFDLVTLPTAPILPPKIDRLLSDLEYYTQINLLALRNTRIGNMLGLCVSTLPTGTASVGISFMAKPGDDEALIKQSLSLEKILS